MRTIKLLFVLLGTPLLLPLVTHGQTAAGGGARPATAVMPRTPDGKPDLTGRWNGSAGSLAHTNYIEEHAGGFGIRAGKSLIIDPADGIIPYQPWALTERNRRRLDTSAYEDRWGHCEPRGIGRSHASASFLYAGNKIILEVNPSVRVIDMDRRTHLPDGIRLWNGDPIGRWDGDTLVVDSTNFNGLVWFGLGGDFHSADAHLVERFTLVDANHLNWTMTITDPKVFTRPWTMTSGLAPMERVKRDDEDFDGEDDCHEGNVPLRHLKNVYDQAREGAAR